MNLKTYKKKRKKMNTTKETDAMLKKVWIYTLQDALITGDNVTSAVVYNALKTKMFKFDPENKITFNRKTINKILTFFKLLGRYRTPKMAYALKNMFLMLPITSENIRRGKKIFLKIQMPRQVDYIYEEYPSIKKALEVYGRKTWQTSLDGVSAGIITRQLKKEKNGEDYYETPIGGGVYIKFSVNDPRDM